jgi:ASC-1-like (ASCH) protein
MIEAEGLAKMFPGVKSTEKAVEMFRGEFHTQADEAEHGVVAFHVKKDDSTHEPRKKSATPRPPVAEEE